MTTDSDNSDIDVCTVEDDNCLHTGLTVVAAETYIETDTSDNIEQVVPLTDKDLLTKSKAEQIAKEKQAKKQEKYRKTSTDKKSQDSSSKRDTDNGTEPDKKVPPLVIKIDKKLITETQAPSEVKIPIKKKRNYEESINSINEGFVSTSALENYEDDLMDAGVSNEFKQFPMESIQLAMKNNRDYQKLLKTLTVLEAQRVQAVKDYEELNRLKEMALADPLDFVKKIQEKTAPEFPKRQQVAKTPEINWLHYLTAYSNETILPQITTRNSSKETDPFDEFNELDIFDDMSSNSQDKAVRSNEKTATFNQKWSVEEQEKLEKLLVMYPPEEVEARRWEKIAKGLGTRTAQQVSSRIQKYFLKLAKAKLPIPGRAPSSASMNITKKKINPISYRRSTFFPTWQPSVFMKDDGEMGTSQSSVFYDDIEVSDEEDVPRELRDSPEYKELMELKRIKKYKEVFNEQTSTGITIHRGFMCDNCSTDPIVGVRWHCTGCPQDQENSLDFCNNCYQKPFENGTHTIDHQLIPIYEATEAAVDESYTTFEQKKFKYNYLDPNFVPTT